MANGSSIALLLEHRGASVLLAADAFEPVLTTAPRAVAQTRGASLPLQLDALKLNHHGSQANVTAEFFGCVQARHHVVSTKRRQLRAPGRHGFARTILHGSSNHNLWLKYGNERNRRWSGEPLQARCGYGAHYPAERAAGVTMALKAAT